jgi:hypothetical protein
VQTWFQNRQEQSEAKENSPEQSEAKEIYPEQLEAKETSSSGALKLYVDTSDAHISSNVPESSPIPKG